ncbi:restriction endonuclease subunit S [Phocaeicola plebeius]|uniref:restriction endonuclease subunit S n=2 Tax=Bacteroidales TaxID=171549 RepID=UPI0026EBF2E8|nr:restriction endonuclease subunit S [Phocaeicola plebeius]
MNKIEQMLQALCPNGVRYLSLGECIEIYTGIQFNKRDMSEVGTYPVLNGGINPSGFSEKYNEEKDTITISQGGASAGYVNWMDCKFWAGAHCFVVKPDNDILNNRYLYFLLKNSEQVLMQAKHGAGIPGLNRDKVKNLIMPIPPLPIQEEIVRILDHFTELTASLQAELQARQEQYEYYRNKLLTFTKIGGGTQSVTWMKMSEICNLQRGKVYSKEYLRDNQGIYPVYSSQTINNGELGRISTYDFDGTYLTWTTDGAYAGTIFKRKGKFSITNVCGIISMKSDLVTMDFLYYWLSLKAKEYVYSGMGNPKLMSNQVEKILVPIPVLSEQQRIVGILDKFETLVNDLSQGLPAEIAAVQEQYEYYRNKLLTFNRIQSN